MSVIGWILAGLLAAIYVGAGMGKLTQPREKLLASPNMAWVNDFSTQQVKAIGAVELLGAIGVLLPWLTNIAPVLTPIAALGLAAVQVGAMITHARRHETKVLPINAVLLILAVAVAVIRFGQL
jgi:uncharacterized membrane protein YkgB